MTAHEARDIEFVLAILRGYEGGLPLLPICQDIVSILPEDDPLLDEVSVVLDSTGTLNGAFGFVEAYQQKKAQIEPWLSDSRGAVKRFAEKRVRELDRQIAREQRRATEDLELRKRDYGETA